jgi:hypothetical protein
MNKRPAMLELVGRQTRSGERRRTVVAKDRGSPAALISLPGSPPTTCAVEFPGLVTVL